MRLSFLEKLRGRSSRGEASSRLRVVHGDQIGSTGGGPTAGNSEERERNELAAQAIPNWWHSIDLGHGAVTNGVKTVQHLREEQGALRIPENLTGKTVLDIGAWDGYYSFEAERRGAKRVVALDHFVWSVDFPKADQYRQECERQGLPVQDWQTVPGVWRPDTLPGKRGFDVARQARGSKVQAVVGDFMQMDLPALGTFDVVFYLGVLYHMRHPLLALERVASVTQELAIIETASVHVPGAEEQAICEFYETAELNDDPTNWWAPNRKALVGLCRAAGFRRVEILTPPPKRTPRKTVHGRLHAHAYK